MTPSDANTVPVFTPNTSSYTTSYGSSGTFESDAGGTAGTYAGTFDLDQVATLDPSIVEKLDPYYLGNGVNTAIVIVTLFLFLAASILNLGVLNHYWNRVKSIESMVPFMCFILSLSDFAVGICAALHTILFILILATKGSPSCSLMWIIVPAHYLSFVAFKVSAFVSMIFAAIRSINMASPLYIINRKAAVISTFIWLFIWSVISLFEMGLFVKQVGLDAFTGSAVTKNFLIAFFYQPGKPKVIELIVHMYFPSEENGDEATNWECVADMVYTALPLMLCVGVALLTTVSQIVMHLGGSSNSDEEKKGSMSLTIILIGVVFIVCASFTLNQPFSVCLNAGSKDWRSLYLMGYLPFFVHSTLNPLVLLARVPQLRECMRNKVTGRSCKHCNSVKYNPVKN